MKNQCVALLGLVALAAGFAPARVATHKMIGRASTTTSTQVFEKISKERRQQLGIGDDEEEYDSAYRNPHDQAGTASASSSTKHTKAGKKKK